MIVIKTNLVCKFCQQEKGKLVISSDVTICEQCIDQCTILLKGINEKKVLQNTNDWDHLTIKRKEELIADYLFSNGVFEGAEDKNLITKDQFRRCIQLKQLSLENESFEQTVNYINTYWCAIRDSFGSESFFNKEQFSIISVTSVWVFFRYYKVIKNILEDKGEDLASAESFIPIIEKLLKSLPGNENKTAFFKKGGELKRFSNSSARYELLDMFKTKDKNTLGGNA